MRYRVFGGFEHWPRVTKCSSPLALPPISRKSNGACLRRQAQPQPEPQLQAPPPEGVPPVPVPVTVGGPPRPVCSPHRVSCVGLSSAKVQPAVLFDRFRVCGEVRRAAFHCRSSVEGAEKYWKEKSLDDDCPGSTGRKCRFSLHPSCKIGQTPLTLGLKPTKPMNTSPHGRYPSTLSPVRGWFFVNAERNPSQF